jgi:hypothetical protein
MIFLIQYDRSKGLLVSIQTYADTDRSIAECDRLELELDLHRRGAGHEVVLLEAASEAALRKTHRRYFETLQQLSQP